MASKKTPDLITTDLDPRPQPSNARFPNEPDDPKRPADMDWRDHRWPNSEVFGDHYWAALFRCRVATFRRMVNENAWPCFRTGHTIWMRASDLLAIVGPNFQLPTSPPKRESNAKAKR